MDSELDFRTRAKEFWRRNQILLGHLPVLFALLFGGYILLRALDSRIGVEGFGDLFGYGLNALRAALIIFTAWWLKRKIFFDLHTKTELRLHQAREKGDAGAFKVTLLDRAEWAFLLCLSTFWYTL